MHAGNLSVDDGLRALAVALAMVAALAAGVSCCVGGAAHADELSSGVVSDDGAEIEQPKTYKGGFLYDTKVEAITVNKKPIYSKAAPDSIETVKGISYDEKTRTLTVKNVSAKALGDGLTPYISIEGDAPVTVNLVGKNTFKNSNKNYQPYFIYYDSSDKKGGLTVTNSGTLTLTNAGGVRSFSAVNVKSGTYKANKLYSASVFCAIGRKLTIGKKCSVYFTQKRSYDDEIYPFQAKTISNSWKSIKSYYAPYFLYDDGVEFKYMGTVYIGKFVNGRHGVIVKSVGDPSAAEVKQLKKMLKAGDEYEGIGHDEVYYRGEYKDLRIFGYAKDAFKNVGRGYTNASYLHLNNPSAVIYGSKETVFEDYCMRGLRTVVLNETDMKWNSGTAVSFLKYSKGKYSIVAKSASRKMFAGMGKNAEIHVEVIHWNKPLEQNAKQVAKLLRSYGLPSGVTIKFAHVGSNLNDRITVKS